MGIAYEKGDGWKKALFVLIIWSVSVFCVFLFLFYVLIQMGYKLW